jgi:hypothetical protein
MFHDFFFKSNLVTLTSGKELQERQNEVFKLMDGNDQR